MAKLTETQSKATIKRIVREQHSKGRHAFLIHRQSPSGTNFLEVKSPEGETMECKRTAMSDIQLRMNGFKGEKIAEQS